MPWGLHQVDRILVFRRTAYDFMRLLIVIAQ